MPNPYTKSSNRGRNGGGGHPHRGGGGGHLHRGGGGGGRLQRGGGGGGGYSNDRLHRHQHAEQKKNSDVLTAMLELLFEKQQVTLYDHSTGMLNLASFRDCPDLKSVQTSVDFSTAAFCESLVSVIQTKLGLPRFINLNNNKMTSLVPFLGALVDAGLQDSVGGISACNNELKNLNFLGPLKKFKNLQELVLAGNADITKSPTYTRDIRRALPSLVGLDGQAVGRQPLSLPFPIRPQLSQEAVSVLQLLEVSLLQQLSAKNLDSLLSIYHAEATFSFTFGPGFKYISYARGKENKGNKDLSADLRQRSSASDYSRNLQDVHATKHIRRGKAEIRLSQEKNVYLKHFDVMHIVDGVANVVFLTEMMKVPTCVITIHGRMQWVHSTCREETQIACFDRTFALVYSNTCWEIVADMLHIRQERPEALFFPDNPSEIEKLQRKVGLNEQIVQAVVRQANSEMDLSWMLADLSPQMIEECTPYAQGDANTLVSLARVASQLQIDAARAHQVLSAHAFSASAAIEASKRAITS
jgi:hypothetical protein